jgi:quercetin dioxygenase-like cupin family protein
VASEGGTSALPGPVDDPHSRQRVVFRRNDPGELQVELSVRRGGFVRDHVHLSQAETFEVVAGTFTLDVDGKRRTLETGSSTTVPPHASHGFPPAADDVQLLVTIRPSLELAGYFRDFLTLSRDGRLNVPESGLPRPILLFAVLMDRYRNEIAAPGFPIWLQRPVFRVLALIGRLFGQKL